MLLLCNADGKDTAVEASQVHRVLPNDAAWSDTSPYFLRLTDKGVEVIK